MAEQIWRGGATAVAQVDHVTPANIEASDIFTVTLADYDGYSSSIQWTAGDTTAKNVVEGLKAAGIAAAAAGQKPWNEVTCTEDDTKLIITADTAGEPFTVTTATTDGGGNNTQTLTRTAGTANASSTWWATAENWESGTAPVNDDTVRIPANAAYGVDGYDASAVTLHGFDVERGNLRNHGRAKYPLHITLEDGATNYDANLAGTGTNYWQIDNAENINITQAGSAPGVGRYAQNLQGVSGDSGENLIHVTCESNQSISLGANAGDDLETDSITITGGDVTVGENVTESDDAGAPDLGMTGGTVETRCPLGTATKTGGTLTHKLGAISALINDAGEFAWKADETITSYAGAGELDAAGDLRAKTITTCVLYSGAILRDPLKKITFTNPITLSRCGVSSVTLDIGTNMTLVRA